MSRSNDDIVITEASSSRRVRFIAGASLAVAACNAPTITNETSSTATRNASATYTLSASVSANSNLITGVRAEVLGADWPMAPIATGSSTYAVTYFASPCSVAIPYTLHADYRAPAVLGSGYSSTVETVTHPTVGGHLLTIVGDPPPASCPATFGTVFNVNSTVDGIDDDLSDRICATAEGQCSLRAAVMQANATSGHDTIVVAAGAYLLTLTGTESTDAPDVTFGDLDITDPVTIRGSSAANTVVDGNGASRLFDVYGVSANDFVRLERMTLRNGFEQGKPGGAVFNRAPLQLDRMVLSDNRLDGSEGGGTCAANVALRECNRGGALFNEGSVLVTDSTFSNNATSSSGTGSGQGGAIANYGAPARLMLERSTIAGNSARFSGGIQNYEGTVEVKNATFAQQATSGWATDVATWNGNVRLDSVTMVQQQSRIAVIAASQGPVWLGNSIVFVGIGSSLCAGTVDSGFANFVGGSTSGSYVAGCALAGVTPSYGTLLLASLDDNGGPTQTIRVIDATSTGALRPKDKGALCPPVDQRSTPRPRDGDGDGTATCDPGALEH